MSTTITTEIARIDEYENAEVSKKEEGSNHAESVTTSDRTIAEALEADAETSPTTENGADLDATQATIDKEISVTDSSESIMPDDDLVPPQTEPNLPDEDTPVVDPAHALILEDEAVAKSAESVFLDDASVTNSLESAMPDDTSIAESATQSWQEIQSNTKTFFENASAYTIAFFKNNRQLWTTLGAIFVVIVSTKLLFAGLDAIEDIPLVAPLLKVIGLVYLVRFGSRYLIRQRDRQELAEKIEHTKAEVLGN
jgi:hypothetical protein